MNVWDCVAAPLGRANKRPTLPHSDVLFSEAPRSLSRATPHREAAHLETVTILSSHRICAKGPASAPHVFGTWGLCAFVTPLEKRELLRGRFRTTIPRLAELSRRDPSSHCRQGWDRAPGTFMSEPPYFPEELLIRLGSRLLHPRPNLGMERVDLGVRVRPRINERLFVKWAY